jgi:signal peptidase II
VRDVQAAPGKALTVQQAGPQQPDGPEHPDSLEHAAGTGQPDGTGELDGTGQLDDQPGAARHDGQQRAESPPRPAGRRRLGLLLSVAAIVFAADVISKTIVVATLTPGRPVWLISGVLDLNLTRNSGAAFSFGTGMTVVFTAIAIGVIIFILRTSRRLRSLPWAVTLGLLLGGAAGNLTDRLVRSPGVFRGDVVDWIQLPHWPVFNVADSCIVCGGFLAVVLAARGIRLDGTREVRPGNGQDATSKPAGEPQARDTQT